MAQIRLCVGTAEGPRSTVWKVVTRQGDIYIISRLMAPAMKVSLHESGQGQWSFTSEWAHARNISQANRHIDRWQVTQLTPDRAPIVFRLLFPCEELRSPGPPDKAESVIWVDPPSADQFVTLEFYVAPHPPETASQWETPSPLVAVLPLPSQRSLVVLRTRDTIDEGKRSVIGAVKSRMSQPQASPPPGTSPPYRSALWIEFEDHVHGFIEIAPHDAAA